MDKSEIRNPDLIEFEHKDLYEKALLVDSENGATFEINASLEMKQIKDNPGATKYYMEDLNRDGRKEYVGFAGRNTRLLVCQDNFKHTASINLESDGLHHAVISFVRAGKENDKIFVQRGSYCFLLSYVENPWYKYLLFIYAGIWLLFYLFMLLVKKLYRNQILKQQALAKEISALQLNSINNQINPHFIFNAMNSITSAIFKEDKEKAYRFGTKFSSLMREALMSSDQVSRTLEKELEFVKNYLDLEKLRFKGKFDYRIETEDDIKMHTEIPKMIIQTFAENSVKHGLGPMKEKGFIVIRIHKHDNMLRIEIEDNGIGRKKARELSRGSTGKGLGIVKQIFDLYKRLKGVYIHYSIIDLTDHSGKATGTLVKLQLPYVY
ncbi:MAG: histidine kinase [Bacteroidota bacterium]|nr:histidine kinase [Bacteroidota bacterium]